MATVFGKEGDEFYSVFYEPDPIKRRTAFDTWVEATTPVVQDAIKEELRAFIDVITQNRWTEDGWREGDAKLHRIQNDYPLVMDIHLRKLNSGEKFRGELPAAANQKVSPNSEPANVRKLDEDDGYLGDNAGHSPNDDRSDSMNPNNDSYHSSMDNHSNQMNPNNDSYWSSRGR